MSKRHSQGKPKFPRRRWLPGQREHVETPKKGKGAHKRSRRRRAHEENDQWLGRVEPPAAEPKAPPTEDRRS